MKRFCKLTALSLQSSLYYRSAFLFNLFSPLILLGGQFLLYRALYNMSATGVIGTYTRPDMYAYILIAFMVSNILTWSSENNLSRDIRSGRVSARCLRPVSFLCQNMADMTGKLIPQAVVNIGVVAALFAVFSRHLTLPDPRALPLAAASLGMGLLLRMTLVSCFSLLCFYTTSHLGLTWVRTALTEFFSGALIPVSLFPLWLRNVSYCTPFPLMLQAPASLLLGEPLPLSLGATFGLQAGWTLLFFALHQGMYARIRRNLTFAGG